LRFTHESIDEKLGRSKLAVPDREPEHLSENRGDRFRMRNAVVRILSALDLRQKLNRSPSDTAIVESSENVRFLTHRRNCDGLAPFQAEVDIVDINTLREAQTPNDRSCLGWPEAKVA